MSKPKIGIVIGSTREGRFGDKPANWIYEIAKARGDIDVELRVCDAARWVALRHHRTGRVGHRSSTSHRRRTR